MEDKDEHLASKLQQDMVNALFNWISTLSHSPPCSNIQRVSNPSQALCTFFVRQHLPHPCTIIILPLQYYAQPFPNGPVDATFLLPASWCSLCFETVVSYFFKVDGHVPFLCCTQNEVVFLPTTQHSYIFLV
jgi:hypothetical protein